MTELTRYAMQSIVNLALIAEASTDARAHLDKDQRGLDSVPPILAESAHICIVINVYGQREVSAELLSQIDPAPVGEERGRELSRHRWIDWTRDTYPNPHEPAPGCCSMERDDMLFEGGDHFLR